MIKWSFASYQEGGSGRLCGLRWSPWYVGICPNCLANQLSRCHAAYLAAVLSKTPSLLVSCGGKPLWGKTLTGKFFWRWFFMTINFLLASNFPLTWGNLVFIVLLGGLRAQGVHTFPFPPVDSYSNLDYGHMKNVLGKVISRAIC